MGEHEELMGWLQKDHRHRVWLREKVIAERRRRADASDAHDRALKRRTRRNREEAAARREAKQEKEQE